MDTPALAAPLFTGPWDLAKTARKYIARLRDSEEGEAVGAKRSRSLCAVCGKLHGCLNCCWLQATLCYAASH